MVVRLHRGKSLEEPAVIDFARDRLAGYKVPTRVFFSEQALPRNATNKVLKRELKAASGALSRSGAAGTGSAGCARRQAKFTNE